MGHPLHAGRDAVILKRGEPAAVITELRRQVDAVTASELQRFAPRLAGLTCGERAAVNSLCDRLTSAILEPFVVQLHRAASTDPTLVEAASFFFGSDGDRGERPEWIEVLRSEPEGKDEREAG